MRDLPVSSSAAEMQTFQEAATLNRNSPSDNLQYMLKCQQNHHELNGVDIARYLGAPWPPLATPMLKTMAETKYLFVLKSNLMYLVGLKPST